MPKAKSVSAALAKDLTKKVIPDFDLEGNIPVTSIHLDGLTLLKIIKHAREAYPTSASGQLLGLDMSEELEVTNCFPFPSVHESSKTISASQYRLEMVRHYKDVGIDSNTVGWYVSSQLDEFLTQAFIDTQASYQKSLGHKCVALVYDSARTSMGNLNIRAYRLSDNFMEVYNKGKFISSNLTEAKLNYSNLLVELPLVISNSQLAAALLQELSDHSELIGDCLLPGPAIDFRSSDSVSYLTPNYSSLELNIEPFFEKNLQTLLDTFEEYTAEQNTLQYYQRGLAREKTRIFNYMQSKQTENETRLTRGLDELPLETEEQVAQKFRIPPEPSRLDLMLVNHHIDTCCNQLTQFGGPALTKMYATQALQLPPPRKE